MFENDKIIIKTYNEDDYYEKVCSLQFNTFIFSLFDNYFRDFYAIANNKDMFYSGDIVPGKYDIYLIYNKSWNQTSYANGIILNLESNSEVLKYSTIIKCGSLTKNIDVNTDTNIIKLCRIRNNNYYQDFETDIYTNNYGIIDNFEFYCALTSLVKHNDSLGIFAETDDKSKGFSRIIIRFYDKYKAGNQL